MHSKWKIWDFLKSNPKVITSKSMGAIAYSCFDPIAFKFVKDRFSYDLFSESNLSVISGKEVSLNWIEDNFKSLGLFGNTESYLIQHADEMNQECKDEILNIESFLLDGRFLILNFNKEEKLFKKLVKLDSIETHQIQAPAFWENGNLLNFLCDEMGVLLNFDAKSLILDKVPATIVDYYNLLSQVKINYTDKVNITAIDITELLGDSKIDNFEFATLFGSKKIKQFYKHLIDLNCDHNELRGIFYFLQSHLTKVYDPTYLGQKSKLTKYDRQIMSQANIWNQSDLKKAINYFGDLEHAAKTKDSFLIAKLRKDYLRTIVRY
jgi:hypothetical protein